MSCAHLGMLLLLRLLFAVKQNGTTAHVTSWHADTPTHTQHHAHLVVLVLQHKPLNFFCFLFFFFFFFFFFVYVAGSQPKPAAHPRKDSGRKKKRTVDSKTVLATQDAQQNNHKKKGRRKRRRAEPHLTSKPESMCWESVEEQSMWQRDGQGNQPIPQMLALFTCDGQRGVRMYARERERVYVCVCVCVCVCVVLVHEVAECICHASLQIIVLGHNVLTGLLPRVLHTHKNEESSKVRGV